MISQKTVVDRHWRSDTFYNNLFRVEKKGLWFFLWSLNINHCYISCWIEVAMNEKYSWNNFPLKQVESYSEMKLINYMRACRPSLALFCLSCPHFFAQQPDYKQRLWIHRLVFFRRKLFNHLCFVWNIFYSIFLSNTIFYLILFRTRIERKLITTVIFLNINLSKHFN